MKKAFFFDRDGIVNRRLRNDYIKHISEFEFLEDFFPVFSLVNQNNFLKILVTNQQCISKNIITEKQLSEIHNFMQDGLQSKVQTKFDDIFFAPELAGSGGTLRKPESGMFLAAIQKYDITAKESWTIGDSISDVIAGKKAETNTILVGDYKDVAEADFIFSNLNEVYHFLKEKFNS